MALNIPWDEWAVVYRKTYPCSRDQPRPFQQHHIRQARLHGISTTGNIQQFMQRCLFADKET